MFRELGRKNRQLSAQECIDLLTEETRGVLSVLGDEGYPYGMPMNHWYNEADGAIYFHCGKNGHRLDALTSCDKVSFCTFNRGEKRDNGWAYRVKSVIVFGRIQILDDREMISDITSKLSHKFTNDDAYIQREIELYAHETLLLKLIPEHISGKWVTEA